ncbi:MAG: rane protein [Humibacillus sp.]|nr:rane protein [Humibacillus sp.]
MLAAGFVGLGGVVFTSIWTNGDSGLGSALLWTAAFGLLGVVLQAVAFRLLDLVTPGDMGAMVVERGFHPASLVAAAAQLAVSLVVTASIA